jgi:hypothetical protein
MNTSWEAEELFRRFAEFMRGDSETLARHVALIDPKQNTGYDFTEFFNAVLSYQKACHRTDEEDESDRNDSKAAFEKLSYSQTTMDGRVFVLLDFWCNFFLLKIEARWGTSLDALRGVYGEVVDDALAFRDPAQAALLDVAALWLLRGTVRLFLHESDVLNEYATSEPIAGDDERFTSIHHARATHIAQCKAQLASLLELTVTMEIPLVSLDDVEERE